MFLGSYTPSFDAKARRIALPKSIRDYLAKSTIVLSFGFEACIFGFDPNTWQKESETRLREPLTDKRSRDFRRLFFSTAVTVKFDDQGRFVIPGNLLEYAQIKKPRVLGAGDHFEIWDEALWQAEILKLQKV